MYKLKLNEKVGNNFRNTVNNYLDFSINKTYHDNEKENAWNSICAIMDRIDDLVKYLNEKELNNGKWKRCAFDFFEFMEQAAVLIECIDEAYKIYGIKSPESNNIFKNKTFNDDYIEEANKKSKKLKTSDKDYFEYIRALSSVHPSKTSRHKEFQIADLEVSPFVVWSGGIYSLDSRCDGEIVLVTYSNGFEHFLTNKSIFINEVFNFVKYKYYSLNYLSKKVKEYNEKNINILRNTKLKKSEEFDNYNDYLSYLIEESKKRCSNLEDDIKEVKSILNCMNFRDDNKIKYTKYCNSLKYAMKIIRRQLQNMDFKGNSICDMLLSRLLLGKIYVKKERGCGYSYYQSKILYLKDNYPGEKYYGRSCYKELLPIFSKYVNISETDLWKYNDNELYILSQVATYFHELENKGLINSFIPNTEDYK